MTPEVDADKASQHQEFCFSSICSHCEKTDFPTDEIGFEMAHVVAARVSATGFVKIIDAGALSPIDADPNTTRTQTRFTSKV